jgi:hypothetical protein
MPHKDNTTGGQQQQKETKIAITITQPQAHQSNQAQHRDEEDGESQLSMTSVED